jgi:hypothetical protein
MCQPIGRKDGTPRFEKLLVNSKAFSVKRLRTFKFNILKGQLQNSE